MPTKKNELEPTYTAQAELQTASQPAMGTQTASQPTVQQPVSYIDNNGQKQQGVAEVPTAKASTGNSYYDNLREGYQTMYDEAVRANQEAAERASQQAREAAEAQRQALATGYQGTNRQLYRDYMAQSRVLPQQMAAAGYSGGLSESARLRLANSYEEALAENERARMGQQASADATLQQRLYEIQAQADAGNQQARQQQLAYEQAMIEQMRQDQLARADTLAAAGDFSGYKDLGYSQSEIDALTRAWLASNPGMTSAWISAHPADARRLGIGTARSGGSGGGYYETPAAAGIGGLAGQITEALLAGATEDEVRADLQDQMRKGDLSYTEANNAWDRAVQTARNSGATVTKPWGPWVAGTRMPR